MKNNFFFPLASSSWDQNEIKAIQKVIKSENFTMGNFVKEAEFKFSKIHKKKYCVMVNSGSSANLLMVAALFFKKDNPLKPGDEVIVPALGWSTTFFPLQQYGLNVKFVDVDLDTLNCSIENLRKIVSQKTRLIMAVNVLGNPSEFDSLKSICKKNNCYLLEDNCESLYADYKGNKTGTFGIMGSFSSYFSHHISTMEGGFILTDNKELYHILLSLRSHGWTRHLPKKNLVSGNKNKNDFYESFNFVLPGYNLRPIEFNGAIALEQLSKLKGFIKQRRLNAKFFKDIMKNFPMFLTQKEIGRSSWFGFSLIIKKEDKIDLKKAIEAFTKIGFQTRPIISGNFLKNPVIKYFKTNRNINNINNADYIHEKGFFIGNHHYDCRKKLEKLLKLKNYL